MGCVLRDVMLFAPIYCSMSFGFKKLELNKEPCWWVVQINIIKHRDIFLCPWRLFTGLDFYTLLYKILQVLDHYGTHADLVLLKCGELPVECPFNFRLCWASYENFMLVMYNNQGIH